MQTVLFHILATMEFDEVFEHTGGFSTYQICLYLMTGLTVFYAGWQHMGMAILGERPSSLSIFPVSHPLVSFTDGFSTHKICAYLMTGLTVFYEGWQHMGMAILGKRTPFLHIPQSCKSIVEGLYGRPNADQ